jgi:hypothetical protein
MLALTFLCMCHRKWLNGLETILRSRDRARLGDVILAFGDVSEIKRAERDYAKQAAAVAGVIAEASVKYSPQFAGKLGNETIQQAVTAPARWAPFMAGAAKGLLAALSTREELPKAAHAVLKMWATSAKEA